MPGLLTHGLVKKLELPNCLDENDVLAIQQLPIRSKRVAAHYRILSDGDRPTESCLIVDGFAYRSKLTPDGQRQILSLHIPGEIPDLQSLHLQVMDHDLTAMTDCTLGFIRHDALRELNARRPRVAAALWRETLVDAAIFREWIINLGRRSAMARMAHLLAELHERLRLIGRTTDGKFELPITQIELADCLGVSVVHVNRTIQQLRRGGLVAIERATFHLLEEQRLEELGQFDPVYLHHGRSM
jgi:CRP-like cAMP-binding protein